MRPSVSPLATSARSVVDQVERRGLDGGCGRGPAPWRRGWGTAASRRFGARVVRDHVEPQVLAGRRAGWWSCGPPPRDVQRPRHQFLGTRGLGRKMTQIRVESNNTCRRGRVRRSSSRAAAAQRGPPSAPALPTCRGTSPPAPGGSPAASPRRPASRRARPRHAAAAPAARVLALQLELLGSADRLCSRARVRRSTARGADPWNRPTTVTQPRPRSIHLRIRADPKVTPVIIVTASAAIAMCVHPSRSGPPVRRSRRTAVAYSPGSYSLRQPGHSHDCAG